MRETRTGRTESEARTRAEEALKERLWREQWKEGVALPVKRVKVTRVGDLYEVEIEV